MCVLQRLYIKIKSDSGIAYFLIIPEFPTWCISALLLEISIYYFIYHFIFIHLCSTTYLILPYLFTHNIYI
jgi:hypothetical protein